MEEITDTNTDKRLDNLKPAWKKGDPSPNPSGRPKGRKNFSTLYYEALEHLAKLNDTTADALELEMHANALKKARAGDFAFYRDTLDRLHGRAVQPTDVSGEVKMININVPPEVAKTFGINATNPETSGSNTEQV